MYDYSDLRASQINSVFPGCVPCGCYDDPDKIVKVPRYDIRLRFGTTVYGNRGRLICQIRLHCDCCEKERTYDVEKYEVYENEIPW